MATSRPSVKENRMSSKDDDGQFIYRPYFTTRSGKRIYASWYGKKAFRIPIDRKK